MTRRAKKAAPVRRMILGADLEALREAEKKAILEVLREVGGDRGEAARRLGVSPRTLDSRIGEYGIREEAGEISREAGFPDRAARARMKAYGGERWKSEIKGREE